MLLNINTTVNEIYAGTCISISNQEARITVRNNLNYIPSNNPLVSLSKQ